MKYFRKELLNWDFIPFLKVPPDLGIGYFVQKLIQLYNEAVFICFVGNSMLYCLFLVYIPALP